MHEAKKHSTRILFKFIQKEVKRTHLETSAYLLTALYFVMSLRLTSWRTAWQASRLCPLLKRISTVDIVVPIRNQIKHKEHLRRLYPHWSAWVFVYVCKSTKMLTPWTLEKTVSLDGLDLLWAAVGFWSLFQKLLWSYSTVKQAFFFLLIETAVGWFILKVPKCEIFHLFDFNDFYGIKSL